MPLCAAHLPTTASVSARAVRVLLRWPGTATPPELAAESLAFSEGVEEVVEVSSVVFQWTGSGRAGNLLVVADPPYAHLDIAPIRGQQTTDKGDLECERPRPHDKRFVAIWRSIHSLLKMIYSLLKKG